MIRGGLRSRLIVDSVRTAVISTLQQLGWFDPTVFDVPAGVRRHQPFRYIARPADWSSNILPNAVAISADDITGDDAAFGGDVEDTFEIYIDVFAEDDAVGWQVSYDIRDSLYGKNPELGMLGPQIDVYDFRLATPASFTTVDIEEIRVDRSQGEAREWQRHWFMLRLSLIDEHNDEAGVTVRELQPWDASRALASQRIHEVEQHVP